MFTYDIETYMFDTTTKWPDVCRSSVSHTSTMRQDFNKRIGTIEKRKWCHYFRPFLLHRINKLGNLFYSKSDPCAHLTLILSSEVKEKEVDCLVFVFSCMNSPA
jgi:hypothetical protein